jgi:hypothetical protein
LPGIGEGIPDSRFWPGIGNRGPDSPGRGFPGLLQWSRIQAEVRRQGLEGSNLRLIDSESEPGALAAAAA